MTITWEEDIGGAATTACEGGRDNRDTTAEDDGGGGDHSSGSSDSSSSSMISFEIALHETTMETCLLEKSNPYYYYYADSDEEMMMIRRKYPWRRFKAFLKSITLNDAKTVVSIVLLFFVTFVMCSLSLSRRQRQVQQQGQSAQQFAKDERHVIEHDYFTTDREYVSDYAPISHKCLFGNDNACTCQDFNPREASEQWHMVHEANNRMVAVSITTHDASQHQQPRDVIFIGDDLVALWAGNSGNLTTMTSTQSNHEATTAQLIHQYFQETFTKTGGGDVNGLALGIAGDMTSSLRWRLKNGELPPQAQAKIWWLSIGANDLDLTRAGCSEEATLLGIVRAAQDIMYHKKHADGSVHVVIQALLPWRVAAAAASSYPTMSSSLSLLAPSDKRPSNWLSSLMFHKEKNHMDTDDNDSMLLLLLPSIQNINKQLAIFCQKHEGLVFFDPSAFIMDSSNSMTSNRGVAQNLSVEQYQVLGDAIHNEVLRIIRNQK